ncbi:hypothetical protein BH09VER1_BH09VER1_33140 [soil metagenome]
MALFHALREIGFTKLVVCHLNHGLRGAASRADAALVRKTAEKFGSPFEAQRVDTGSFARAEAKSLETAARELRMSFFEACARKHRCPHIFLAHHRDDQVETILFNFLRGSGAAGLGGMKVVSQFRNLEIIRPLLGVSRAEITAYVRAAKIPFREDQSNTDPVHTRNRLRHQLIPEIEKSFGKSFGDAVVRAGEILREEDAWMASQVPPISPKLRCRALKTMPLALQRRTVLAWLRSQGMCDAGYQETSRVLSLLNDGSGPAKVSLPGGVHARRRAGEIFWEAP